MAEYIEREGLVKSFSSEGCHFIYGEPTVKAIISRINNTPTADVVEVVRCCKCKYGNKHNDCNGNEYYGCDINIDIGEVREVEPIHYCSYGERRCEE